jgi:hypothetical protein
MVRLCAETLPTGSQCQQFALRGRPWCRAHAEPHQRERIADTRQIMSMARHMNVFAVACLLQNTLYELRTKVIPPLHAEAIFDAALARLEHLKVEEARVMLAHAERTDNSHQKNQLHPAPMK